MALTVKCRVIATEATLYKKRTSPNKVIAVTLAGGERPFVTYKRHYGLGRTQFLGLAKNATAYGLAAMAASMRKGAKFLTLYGVPRPSYTG